MDFKIDASEVYRVLNNVKQEIQDAEKKLKSDFEEELMKVYADAVKKAPVDKGILRAEARWEMESIGDGMQGTVEFGGLASEYAEYQHEKEMDHPKGGQDHYLYGTENSAWNSNVQKSILEKLGIKTLKTIEKRMK